jgi:hypothetical protein
VFDLFNVAESRKNAVLFFLISACLACHSTQQRQPLQRPVRDYITVGKMMDTIQPPYIIDLHQGKKRLVFIGCDHNQDSLHPQYAVIARYANDLKPQIAFNEGGQVADTVHYISLQEAANKNGEVGALKFFADQLKFPMLNGDIPFSFEWQLTLKKQTAEDLFLYYTFERFVIPYKYGAYGDQPFDQVFTNNTLRYFKKHGFPLTAEMQSFAGFRKLYALKTSQQFNIADVDIEAFDYVNDTCHFCAVGRSSKMVRDSILLNKIDSAFLTNDRVMVNFGHGHALALEPALIEMMQQFNK